MSNLKGKGRRRLINTFSSSNTRMVFIFSCHCILKIGSLIPEGTVFKIGYLVRRDFKVCDYIDKTIVESFNNFVLFDNSSNFS